jgi:hypothetical protein
MAVILIVAALKLIKQHLAVAEAGICLLRAVFVSGGCGRIA